MISIEIVRTTPLNGEMVAPGRVVSVDEGLARALCQSGKARPAQAGAEAAGGGGADIAPRPSRKRGGRGASRS